MVHCSCWAGQKGGAVEGKGKGWGGGLYTSPGGLGKRSLNFVGQVIGWSIVWLASLVPIIRSERFHSIQLTPITYLCIRSANIPPILN